VRSPFGNTTRRHQPDPTIKAAGSNVTFLSGKVILTIPNYAIEYRALLAKIRTKAVDAGKD
jgi:hypothetical protein